MAKDRWEDAREARTLRDANVALGRLRPHRTEQNPKLWLNFYQRSAAIYREVAEIDRTHHHEATAWATTEQSRADEWAVKSEKAKK